MGIDALKVIEPTLSRTSPPPTPQASPLPVNTVDSSFPITHSPIPLDPLIPTTLVPIPTNLPVPMSLTLVNLPLTVPTSSSSVSPPLPIVPQPHSPPHHELIPQTLPDQEMAQDNDQDQKQTEQGENKKTKKKPRRDELKFSDIKFETKIGEGGFGEVYQGHLWGQEVAIKKLRLAKKNDGEIVLKRF